MATQLLNKKSNKTIIFSDELEADLLEMKNCNMHDDVRIKIAETLGLSKYVEKFGKFANLPFKTMEQMNERMKLTQAFLSTIDSLYGCKAVNYITQFL